MAAVFTEHFFYRHLTGSVRASIGYEDKNILYIEIYTIDPSVHMGSIERRGKKKGVLFPLTKRSLRLKLWWFVNHNPKLKLVRKEKKELIGTIVDTVRGLHESAVTHGDSIFRN